ncbi:MAG: hypothetical protein BMS9Abin31_0815 [Gammaproteobacteria bacterium]|nr:MAG: hypothetical protein BMS9Abin31_0815 [Gammaproteobacteria bacterium]
MQRYTLVFLILQIFDFSTVIADQNYRSNYVGQDKRIIKSLSIDDIKQLENGKGWGLAKAAELNGVPGPSHLLEMKKEINLTNQQQTKIKKLFKKMQQQAKVLGKQLIVMEKKLNESFANKTVKKQSLKMNLEKISQLRMQLRYVHLSAHLETPSILTKRQINLYNKLRGYNSTDPCLNMPKGHDAKMWKSHNGCV